MAQYLIKRGPGLRYYGFIPEAKRPKYPLERDGCELTAFWMTQSLGRYAGLAVYIWMQVDLYRYAARAWIIVGTERASLRTRYRLAFAREVWVGEDPATGITWYIDGIPRRQYLGRLITGIPQMALLQLRQRGRPGYGRPALPAPEASDGPGLHAAHLPLET